MPAPGNGKSGLAVHARVMNSNCVVIVRAKATKTKPRRVRSTFGEDERVAAAEQAPGGVLGAARVGLADVCGDGRDGAGGVGGEVGVRRRDPRVVGLVQRRARHLPAPHDVLLITKRAVVPGRGVDRAGADHRVAAAAGPLGLAWRRVVEVGRECRGLRPPVGVDCAGGGHPRRVGGDDRGVRIDENERRVGAVVARVEIARAVLEADERAALVAVHAPRAAVVTLGAGDDPRDGEHAAELLLDAPLDVLCDVDGVGADLHEEVAVGGHADVLVAQRGPVDGPQVLRLLVDEDTELVVGRLGEADGHRQVVTVEAAREPELAGLCGRLVLGRARVGVIELRSQLAVEEVAQVLDRHAAARRVGGLERQRKEQAVVGRAVEDAVLGTGVRKRHEGVVLSGRRVRGMAPRPPGCARGR
jgi:hypothetical protein